MAAAISFLTPFGKARVPSRSALDWFPAVGAVLGLVVGMVWWLGARAWPSPVPAAMALATDLALTGMLHLDGLADAADGLLAPVASRQRRLDVMAEPAVGAFGVGAVVVVLVLRFAALAALRPSVLLVAALWCASRSAMAVIARAVPYARPEGLATAFLSPPAGSPGGRRDADRVAVVGSGLSCGLAVVAGGPLALGGVVGGALAVGGVVALAHRRLGGFTGDVLGAAGMAAETVGLLVLAVRW